MKKPFIEMYFEEMQSEKPAGGSTPASSTG